MGLHWLMMTVQHYGRPCWDYAQAQSLTAKAPKAGDDPRTNRKFRNA